jgi:hypothetical protein
MEDSMTQTTRRARFAPFVALLGLLAVVLGACGSSAPALSDPKEILSKGISNLSALKSFHVDLTIAGTVKVPMGGSSSSATPFKLDGTALTADIDVANKQISASFSAPALLGFAADLVLVGSNVYLKAPLVTQSDKWLKQPVTDSATATVTDPQKTIDELKKFMDQPGVTPAKQGDEKVGDQDCYKVSFTIPASLINSAAGSATQSLPSGMSIGDIPVVAWVRKADQRLAKMTIDIALGEMGTLSVGLSMSKFDEPVKITEPPADQVQNGSSG